MPEAIALGLLAGVVAGLLGVGGGVLFVPALTIFLGHSQVEAEATSLLAMIPVAAVGVWRQHRYGNVRWPTARLLLVGSLVGAPLGVVAANALPEHALRIVFAIFLLVVAWQLAMPRKPKQPVEEEAPA
jgi:uncharacterized protein